MKTAITIGLFKSLFEKGDFPSSIAGTAEEEGGFSGGYKSPPTPLHKGGDCKATPNLEP